MGEEHAKGDIVAAGVRFSAGIDEEFGDYADDGGVEFEEATFVEEGGGGSGRYWFRE
jgi:hypothetical protein